MDGIHGFRNQAIEVAASLMTIIPSNPLEEFVLS